MSVTTLINLPPQWLSILFLVPILTMFLFRKKGEKGMNYPPGPPKLPIIGNLHQLGSEAHKALWKMSRKYGPIMMVQFGSVPAIIISTPEYSKAVFKDFDLETCSRPPSTVPGKISYNYLDVAFAPYSDYWREMRKLVIFELLSMKKVHMLWYAREVQIEKLIDTLNNAYPSPINLTKKIFEITDGFIGNVAFGNSYGKLAFKNELSDVVHGAMDMLGTFHASDFFPTVGKFIDWVTGDGPRQDEVFRQMDGYLQKVLEQHLDPERPKPEHEDLVDILLGLMRDRKSSFQMTHEHIKAVLVDIYIGAIDTTTVTTMWAFAELLKNQKLLNKARDEVRTVVGPNKSKVEPSMLDKLKFLDCVIKETFRFHPPVPLLIPHFSMKHVKIGGYDIPPNTSIFVNTYALGRDPDRWDNPEIFYPERFENTRNRDVNFTGSHYELVPAGAGRRICPGLTMGAAATKHFLANLLYGYDYELPDGLKFEDIPMVDTGKMAVYNKHDIIVIPKKHEW